MSDIKKEVGYVKALKSYLLQIEGLPSVKINDLLISESGSQALVKSLEENVVYALLVNQSTPLPTHSFYLDPKGLSIKISDALFGRVINPLGEPIDGGREINKGETLPIQFDVVALGIGAREEITEQLETGIIVVDMLMPLGKGQRELIFGEPRSGKTTFIIDTLKTQHDQGAICIYTLIGKEEKEIKEIVTELGKNEALERTIIIAATIKDKAPLISIVPHTAMTIADYYRAQGKEVLLILDDLGAHAKYLREVSLLMQTLPGREAYPGDIFYQQAHLIERAGRFNAQLGGGGTISLLPIIETDLDNFSALIPTNLMASTDGHLLFSISLRAEGYYPALDVDYSVTRVGRKTQHPLLKQLADKVKPILAEFETLKSYGMFGAEFGKRTQEGLRIGNIVKEMLKQEPNQRLAIQQQILFISLIFTNFMKSKDKDYIIKNKGKLLLEIGQQEYVQLVDRLSQPNIDLLINELNNKTLQLEQSMAE